VATIDWLLRAVQVDPHATDVVSVASSCLLELSSTVPVPFTFCTACAVPPSCCMHRGAIPPFTAHRLRGTQMPFNVCGREVLMLVH